MRQIFQMMDSKGTGNVDSGDIHRLMARYGRCIPKLLIDEFISEVDVNNDRLINFDEFLQYMRS